MSALALSGIVLDIQESDMLKTSFCFSFYVPQIIFWPKTWSFFFSAVSSFLPYKVWSHTKESGSLHLYLKTLRDLREFLADQTFPLSQTSPFINEEQRGWPTQGHISEWNQVLCLQSSSLQGSSSGISGPRISFSIMVLSKVSHALTRIQYGKLTTYQNACTLYEL